MSLLKKLFGEDEVKKLNGRINKIKRFVEKYQLDDPGKIELISERLKRISEISDQALSEFDDPDFKIFEILKIDLLLDYVYPCLDDPEFKYKLDQVPNGDGFRKECLNMYDRSGLNSDRKIVIENILNMHKECFYSGSVVLAYTQIEGILNDVFLEIGAIKLNVKGNYIALDSFGNQKLKSNGNEIQLNGLISKINHVKSMNKKAFDAILINDVQTNGNSVKLVLDTYELNFGESSSKIPSTRNKILHGQDISYFTSKRSAQLILWIYSILSNITDYKKAP